MSKSCVTKAVSRYQWVCHTYCLMDNHYHLLLETPRGNLSEGMRHLNGVYTQGFNRSHKRVGHVFQGRFKGILVQKDSHLLELARYVVLNPVRAKEVKRAEDYLWSSYQATLGLTPCPAFLQTSWLLSQFGPTRGRARQAYHQFVNAGQGDRPWDRLTGQMYFGDEKFVDTSREKVEDPSGEIPRIQRHPLRPSLRELLSKPGGIARAYREHGYRLKEMAEFLKTHYSTVSRRLKREEVLKKDLTPFS